MEQKLSTEERIALRDELFNILEQSNVIFTSNGKYRYSKKQCFLNSINNLNLKLKYDLYVQQFRSEEEALYCLLHQDDFENHKCECGTVCEFYNYKNCYKYRITCGKQECAQKYSHSDEANKKRDNTKYNRYGDKNYNNREKAKETCKKEYNVEHTSKLPKVIEKGKDTKNKKYGDPNYNNREKAKETCLNKYGEDNPAKVKEIQDRIKETNIIRYGKPYPMQVEEFAKACKEHFLINNILKKKNLIIDDNLVKELINELNLSLKFDKSQIYANDEYFIQFIKILHEHRKRSLKIFEICDLFHLHPSTIGKKISRLQLQKYFDIKDSDLELKFKQFLDDNDIKAIRRNRELRNDKTGFPLEIDFVLEDHNIGFEINDIATHNIKQKDQFYHYNKTLQCAQKGIRLIHIWEWELIDEELWRRTSSWILNLLNCNKIQINFNDCIIKKVLVDEEKEFEELYDLNGYLKSDICYGAYHNQELIQLLSLQRNDNNQYELLKLITKFGYNFTDNNKLLSYIMEKHYIKSIIAKCNLDKYDDGIYEKMDFKLIKFEEPQIIQCKYYGGVYDCGQNIYIIKKE